MDWFEKLEERKAFVIFSVGLISAAALIVSSLRIFVGFDAYWQLQMGKDWIENGLSPWVDHYSFTFPGAEIVSPPVIFQVALHALVDWLGEFGGFFVMRLAAFLLTLGMMVAWLRTLRAPALAYMFVLPLLTVLLQLRAIVRPELLSYSISILAVLLYRRTCLQLSARAMWPIVVLMLFWTNYHSSILGYVIFFGLFVDIALRLIAERAPLRSWMSWAGWGLVLIGIGFLNPGFHHIVLQTYYFPEEWGTLIQEYTSPKKYSGVPAIYPLMLLSMITALLLLKQKKVGYLAIALVFAYAGLKSARMVTPGGIVMLCLFAQALTDFRLGERLKRVSPWINLSAALLTACLFLAPLLDGVHRARSFMAENREPHSHLPQDLADYMIATGKSGRVFNFYEVGGYLIHRLPQHTQVYIDGRTGILYPLEHYLRYMEAWKHEDTFAAEVEKYDIEFAILDDSSISARLMAKIGFELDFADYQYALYARENGRFPYTGRLWAKPYCWDSNIATALEREWRQATIILPPHVAVLSLLSTAREYRAAVSQEEFFVAAAAQPILTDPIRRFLGYRAIESGLFETAAQQFGRIAKRELKDLLALALTQLRLGDPESAEKALDQVTRVPWANIEFNDLLIQHALLHEIAKQHPLELFESGYVDDLDTQVGDYGLPARGETLSVSAFCSDGE